MDALVSQSTDAPVPLGEFVPEADRRIVLGINKREIYRRLGIREAWFWKRDVLAVFVLEGDQYVERDGSDWVPGVDLAMLCRLAAVTPVSAAVAELRELLRAAT
jgi:hypothetical protein